MPKNIYTAEENLDMIQTCLNCKRPVCTGGTGHGAGRCDFSDKYLPQNTYQPKIPSVVYQESCGHSEPWQWSIYSSGEAR